jgi:hypothetical protein
MNEAPNVKNITAQINEPTLSTPTPEQHIDALRAIKGQMLWMAKAKEMSQRRDNLDAEGGAR